ncbi:hypothetical protein [Niallia nealsonii]|uniref:Uncharacterized protein n=1 Tax=Niallia nealsonii TaxID=115979 RepID=A0A2N0Z888_9BACI|nr:hypothetical protein [Niallia nealsonii]PKG25718.1 hypothetical protein CWS01_00365 [Niallia nealsonii]
MFLYLPEKFDENEWFIIISFLIACIIIWRLPKRFPTIITVLLFLFISAVSKLVDHILSGSFKFDLYDFNDSNKYELFDSILQWLLYPAIGYILVYWYDYWNAKGGNRFFLIVVIIVLSTLYEALSVKCHVFYFKGWLSYFSAGFYSFAFPLTIIYHHLLNKWYQNRSSRIKTCI